ncbi:enoyl-CoA hydratase/isomerase family protein [Pseudoalteromonas agarivorans]|uniref:enoyl-CoA hydratase/isomerase family protein n=1 Tax=Pseudoalteromonas TaxID=53246 RepID=UPI00110AEEB0|nr:MULTISPECIES: enoyl-CoA hydratase/isomerase family protein [Pseudoalteromonas]MCQ8885096.1 enoyl-CoA hydratase/isomerase family protein [Pseudoalteromonas agarivorans]TMP18120.1 enoyl-CoA hydratase/isomerase family protein [Pseudoalteromonas sp. S2893]
MKYEGFTTFNTIANNGILTVTFDYAPVNVQGLPMLADLTMLAQKLEADKQIKVVVFQSAHPEIFVSHADTDFLKDMSDKAVPRNEVKLLDLQVVLERISKLPQATIAKIEGFARGGGHEFALACDMRFAARGKAKFMQMEVGMGILPCGGGASRMARQTGLGRALEIVLSADDFDADQAEFYGTVNRALNPDEIGPYVDKLAKRIALWPSESINATKQAVYESIDLPIQEALRAEAYWLYQATSQTPALRRFKYADEQGAEYSMENQRNWPDMVVSIQDVK